MPEGYANLNSPANAGGLEAIFSASSLLGSPISVHSAVFKRVLEARLKETTSISLPQLHMAAESLINKLTLRNDWNTFDFSGSTVRLDTVLREMLCHAGACGGMEGERYVIGAIMACVIGDPGSDDTLSMLHDLGKTWVTNFLFVFRMHYLSDEQSNKVPSQVMTPTPGDARGIIGKGVSRNRGTLFETTVKCRAGYQCAISDRVALDHPRRPPGVRFPVIGCHILPRTVAVPETQDPDVITSTLTAFDILRNFSNMSENTLEDLESIIDSPTNAFTLYNAYHVTFRYLNWCLQETQTPHHYKIETYGPCHGLEFSDLDTRIIEFKDKSEQFADLMGDQHAKHLDKHQPIPLPNPLFFRIHAAIVGVLHRSGAATFFDELLQKYRRGQGDVPVLCWEQFERAVAVETLRKKLSETVIS